MMLNLKPHEIKDHPLFESLQPYVVNDFLRFHYDNPTIFDLYEKYTFQVKQAGLDHYSASAITQRIRWHLNVETKGDDFKINNNHSSCYARLLIIKHPSLETFFQLRSSTGNIDELPESSREKIDELSY
jgi:hypothetical protein